MPSSAVATVRTVCDRRLRSAAIAERTYGSSSTMSTRAISRTVCIRGFACGIITDMVRVAVGLAAWAAGTAIAVCVAWFGANVVVSNAGVSSGIPVISPTVMPPSAGLSPAAVAPAEKAPSRGTPASRTTAPRTSASPPGIDPSPSAASSSPAAGDVRAYAPTGGHVTLDVTDSSVQLVSAVPDAGYSVRTWTGTDWLRVDFSSGPQVSSLIASWNGHAPIITVTN